MSCLERIGRLGIDVTEILFERTVNYNMVFRLNPLHPDLIESLSFGSVFSYLSEKFDQTVSRQITIRMETTYVVSSVFGCYSSALGTGICGSDHCRCHQITSVLQRENSTEIFKQIL